MTLKICQLVLPIFAFGLTFVLSTEPYRLTPVRASEESIEKVLRAFAQARHQVEENESELFPVENKKWRAPWKIGQISGISVDPAGKPVIFHRAGRVWTHDTFDENFKYSEAIRGPIQLDTILTLNPSSGTVENGWGSNIFFLPHGLHIDHHGTYWLTDVALHQVFKFSRGSTVPELVLGESFVPGNDRDHFCQPTSVAVSRLGEVVVTDGYCNNRIMIFDYSGNLLDRIPQPGEFMALRIPHGVTILESGEICVADRENMRVICMNAGIGGSEEKRGPPLTIQQPDLGRVFAIASYGNTVYAVNGLTSPLIPIQGFIMNPKTETIDSHWGPTSGTFTNPHAMAISPNGTELYVSEIGPNRVWKFDLVRINRVGQTLRTVMKIINGEK